MKAPVFTFIVLFATHALYAQLTRTRAMDELIAAENAFATLSQQTSFVQGFLRHLDSAGVVFNGAQPVNGLSFYTSLPASKGLLLKWYPVQAALAAGNDMGFTTGPYLLLDVTKHDTLAAGNYFSVWRKNNAGVFKVLLDGGVTHSGFAHAREYGHLTPATTGYVGKLAGGIPHNKNLATDQQQFVALAATNLLQAYKWYMADRCYFLRADMATGLVKTNVLQTLSQQNAPTCRFTAAGSFYSADSSWCLSYGTVGSAGNATSETQGYYVQVWQYQPGGWKIIADVLQWVKKN